MSGDSLDSIKIDRNVKPGPGSAPRARPRWPYVLTIVLVAAWQGTAYYLARPIAVQVKSVATAFPSQALVQFNATGYVVAQRKADVASKATGRIESMAVEEGNNVIAEAVLARLENRDLVAAAKRHEANIAVEEAHLVEARAEHTDAALALARTTKLIGKAYVTREVHDAARARHDKAAAGVTSAQAAIRAARAAHREAEVAVEYTLIRAPFDGVILRKYANVGDVVAPFGSTTQSKGAVVSMADMGSLQVEADVAESNLGSVRIGQPAEVQLDALPDARLRGAVRSIVPTVDRSKATVIAKIEFIDQDPRILPEMSAKVGFLSKDPEPADRQAVTVVPPQAIVARNGRDVVFVVRDAKVSAVPVKRGARLMEQVAVQGDLVDGDQVVIDPPRELDDGATVSIVTS